MTWPKHPNIRAFIHNFGEEAVYRVEKRSLLGRAFVNDPQTGDYLRFDETDKARHWVKNNIRRNDENNRCWEVVSECNF